MNNEEIIQGILQDNSAIIMAVYRKNLPGICRFVLSHTGSREDAHDIFQEAMIIIYKKISTRKLVLTCPFSTYLQAVCRRIWLSQKSRGKGIFLVSLNPGKHEFPGCDTLEDDIVIAEKESLYREHFSRLGKSCRKLLQFQFDRKPMIQIAKLMGYASAQYARKKRFLCKEKLSKSIRSDPRFKELIGDD